MCRNFVKVTEKFSIELPIFGPADKQPYTTVWKLRKFTLTHFWQKFRESNTFTKEITK